MIRKNTLTDPWRYIGHETLGDDFFTALDTLLKNADSDTLQKIIRDEKWYSKSPAALERAVVFWAALIKER